MASAVVGTLRILLEMNSAEVQKELAQVSKGMGSLGRDATQLGSALTRTLTVPLLGVGAGAVKLAMDFESSFAGVRKTVDATDAEFAQMEQSFRDLSKTIPVNVNEINKLGEAAGALGIPKEQIVDFAKVMAQLGVTTNLTSDQAADAIARIQNIFGAAGKDTERLASTIVALGNAGASTEKEITEMAQRIAGAGHSVGLTQAQVVSFASSLASVGINAEAGGSAISRIFLKMNDAVAKGGGGLKEFARVAGMTAAEFKQKFQTDAAGATVAFIEGLGRLKASGENVNGTMEGLIGKNIILKDTLLRLSGAGDLLKTQLNLGNVAWKENTALTKEAGERFKTTESQMILLWNKIKDVGITLGQSLIPILRDLMTVLEPVVMTVAKAAEWFGKLPEPIRLVAVGIAGLVAAIGPLLFIFGQVTSAIGLVAGAFTAKGVAVRGAAAIMGTTATATIPAMLAALGPLAVAVAGVTAAVAIGTQAWKLWGEHTERNKGAEIEQQRRYAMMEQAAKIAGRSVLTYGEAVQIVTAHVRKNVDAQEKAQQVYTEAAGPPARLAPVIKNVAEVSEEATAAIKKQTDALKALKAEYAGADTFAAAALHMKAIGDVTKLTKEEQQRALGILQQAVDKWNATGQAADRATLLTLIRLDAMNTKLKDSTNLVETLGLKFETSLATPALLNQFDPMKFLVPLKAGLGTQGLAGGVTFGGAMMQGIKGSFQQLGPTIMGALQGGGSVLKSVGALFGQGLGDSFVTNFGTKMVSMLGPTLGGAFNMLIPGLGALLGPLLGSLAGKIGSWFKGLFGIDPAIKAARTELEGFQAQLRKGLTDQQKQEAGNEQWKMDIIAIRDAFLKVGKSEEEALKIAEALWDTDNPERSKRAMEEIQRVMDQIARETEQATDAANDLGDALDDATVDRRVNVTVDYDPGQLPPHDPNQPGTPEGPSFPGGGDGFPSNLNFNPVGGSALSGLATSPMSAVVRAPSATSATSGTVVHNNLYPLLVTDRTEIDTLVRATERHMAERGVKGNEFGLREMLEDIMEQVVDRKLGSGLQRA